MSCAVVLLGVGWWRALRATDLESAPLPAGSHERIVVVGTVEDHSFVGRVAAELRAMNVDGDLRIVESDANLLGHEIDLALQGGARAVVHPDSHIGRIDMLFADPVTRRVTLRMSLNGSPMPTVEPVLAIRAMEFVRAMLLGTPLVLPPLTPQLTPPEPARLWAGSAVISSGAA